MQSMKAKQKKSLIASHVKEIMKILGYNLNNEHLRKTPARFARIFFDELDTSKIRNKKTLKKLYSITKTEYNSMVVFRHHKTQTRCPHHLERVELDISVGYIPNGRLIGLSKLGRIADYFSQGLMLQEEIAEMIANGIQNALKPKGVGVCIKAEHGCIKCRGLESKDSDVITSEMRGVFLEDLGTRTEFLQCLK